MQHKTKDVVTLFHKANQPSSVRAHSLLKQLSALASETATVDQASDHSEQNKMQRSEFQLDVTEEPPTTDQLRSIFEYVGEFKCGQLLEGSRNATEAMKILKQSPDSFRRPVVSLTFSDN